MCVYMWVCELVDKRITDFHALKTQTVPYKHSCLAMQLTTRTNNTCLQVCNPMTEYILTGILLNM